MAGVTKVMRRVGGWIIPVLALMFIGWSGLELQPDSAPLPTPSPAQGGAFPTPLLPRDGGRGVGSYVPDGASAAPWPTLTARYGLAATPAVSLAVGPDNALWIGGLAGVTRWDGQRAEVWSKADGLGDEWVSALAVVDGVVWAGTHGGGLARFDPANPGQPWRRLTVPARQDARLAQQMERLAVTALTAGPDGSLWVGAYGVGLLRVHGDQVERISNGPPSPWITALAVAPNGDLWLGTSGEGVARFDGQTWTVYTQSLPDPAIRSLTVDNQGRVYVGTGLGLAVRQGDAWRVFGPADGLPDRRVISLGVDGGGTVWAGTPTGLAARRGDRWEPVEAARLPSRYVTALVAYTLEGATSAAAGLAVATPGGVSLSAAQSLPAPPAFLPVVFVHGWRGAPFASVYASEARFLARWLAERGQLIEYAPGIDSGDTLFANAARLRDFVAEVRRRTGAPKVHLIGHSMGGLTARAYLESALYQGDVASLTTLGSPHSGAVQWRDYLLHEIKRGSAEPSARELLPEHVALFNQLGQKPADVPYYLYGGDITQREGLEWLNFWPPTDTIVDLWSALSLRGPGVTPIETQDLHGWAAGSVEADIPSYLWPADNFRATLRDILSGQAPGPLPPLTPVERPVAPPRTPLVSDTINPGQTVTQTLTLDAAPSARVMTLWERGTMTVTLTSPSGVVYRQRDADGVDFLSFANDTFANVAVYRLTRPQPGRWQVTLQSARGGRTVNYGVYAELDSPLTLSVQTEPQVVEPSAPVRVTARLTPTERARDATVSAVLSSGGYASSWQTLTDDGSGGDTQAGDGVFSGTLRAPTEANYYVVDVTARGPDGAFERSVAAVVQVRPTSAWLAGAAARRPGPDGVRVDVPVRVEREGPLAVAVRLQKGEQTWRGVLPVTLAAGQSVVTVPVRGAPPDATLVETLLLDNRTALIPIERR